jgi:hypothetical protein
MILGDDVEAAARTSALDAARMCRAQEQDDLQVMRDLRQQHDSQW